MATPLGHALAGYAVYSFARGTKERDDRGLMLLCLFAATAPDLDFLPGALLGSPALYHQGITHSLGFALLVSLGVAGVGRLWGKPFSMIFYLGGMAYLSHLVIDFLGPDTRPPHGIPLLWPISAEHFMSPVSIFLGVRHAASAATSMLEWLEGLLHPYNFAAMAVEVALLLPFILLGQWRRRVLGRQYGRT
jgi:inner membrane protein